MPAHSDRHPADGDPGLSGRRKALLAVVAVLLTTAVVTTFLLMRPSGTPTAAHPPPAPSTTGSPGASPGTPDVAGGPSTADDSRRIGPRKLSRALDKRRVRLLLERVKATTVEEWRKPAVFKVGTFNVLGSNHTAPGGDKPGHWPSGAARLPGAVERIKAHGVSVVGLQEVQPNQYSGLVGGTGFAAYPTASTYYRDRRQVILYDPDVWKFISGKLFTPTGAYGPGDIVLLEHRATGRRAYFVNVHPPAGYSGRVIGLRMRCYAQIAAVINDLKESGTPVILTGDMNDRGRFASHMLPATGMVSSRTGSTTPVDWVVATPDVAFSGYIRDTSPVSRRISDHFFISATATIGASDQDD